MIIGVIAIIVVCGVLFALALARAAAIGDEALEAKRNKPHRHWWEW